MNLAACEEAAIWHWIKCNPYRSNRPEWQPTEAEMKAQYAEIRGNPEHPLWKEIGKSVSYWTANNPPLKIPA